MLELKTVIAPSSNWANHSVQLRGLVGQLQNRLNAVVVCLSHSWGGLEQVAAHDAVSLGSLGLQIRVLCLEDSPIHKSLQGRKEVGILTLREIPRNFLDWKMKEELEKLLAEGVNLIHTHQTTLLGSISPWIWRKPQMALFATRHIMNGHSKKDLWHRWIYSRVDFLLVMSRRLRRNVLETHAFREKDIKVINLGLDFDLFDPDRVNPVHQRTQWGVDPETRVIGLVGRIDPAKGQATFIRAAAGLLMKRREGERLKFVMVGEETLGNSGEHLGELRQMVEQFKIGDSILFAGYQENIPEVMRAFDIFVMPSKQEAFGLVAIEAMAMECPIIISSGGSSEEIVGHEEFGLTVRPDDAFDLQRQIRYLLDHPQQRVEMGRRARNYVKHNYDHHKRLIKTLTLYERALKRRGGYTSPEAQSFYNSL
jgi:glycosyltransferase involved in cell wall biosynthesis